MLQANFGSGKRKKIFGRLFPTNSNLFLGSSVNTRNLNKLTVSFSKKNFSFPPELCHGSQIKKGIINQQNIGHVTQELERQEKVGKIWIDS